jgi:glutaconate CoA-transferase subunit B
MTTETTAATAPEPGFTSDEMMSIAAARALTAGQRCFVGIGLPSTAANLARRTHAPDLVLIYESGTLGSKPGRLPASIGDGILAETADAVISVPEVFNYWLQPGRVDVGFLGGAQLDKFANINTTVIGSDYAHPKVRLPGAGGAPEIAVSCHEVYVVMRQSRRSFVERVDFVTSFGHGRGKGDRERLGLHGAGPTLVITDLGVFRPDPDSAELVLTQLHPGIEVEQVRAATGWDLKVSAELSRTPAPTETELKTLRELKAAK